MKSKKGFTLIELLAVIVILAIIAIIATPIVLNIINDVKNVIPNIKAVMIGDGKLKAVCLDEFDEGIKHFKFIFSHFFYICFTNVLHPIPPPMQRVAKPFAQRRFLPVYPAYDPSHEDSVWDRKGVYANEA